MLSVEVLDQLCESDVGRRFVESPDLQAEVRIESHPVRRIVVDFIYQQSSRAMRIGTWPDSTLASIRQTAERLRNAPAEGASTRRPAVAVALSLRTDNSPSVLTIPVPGMSSTAEPPLLTVEAAFTHWRHAQLRSRKDAGESVYRSMCKDVLPNIGAIPLGQVDESQIVLLLQKIIDRGSARQAGCVLADLRQMFRWALHEGWIDDDPTAGLRKIDLCGAQEARNRSLSHAEIAELALRMRSAGLAHHIRRATWLMLSTGARIGEIACIRWSDVNLEARTWTIPAQYSHSGRVHVVPLSEFALRHLRPEDVIRRDSQWVFPGRMNDEPLSPKALGKQIRDRQRGTQIRGRSAATRELLLSGGAWTPLDLRRTAAALLADLKVKPEVIAACLDRVDRTDERIAVADRITQGMCREAFDRLGRWLESVERPAVQSHRMAA